MSYETHFHIQALQGDRRTGNFVNVRWTDMATDEAMYVQHNIGTRSRIHCWRGKAKSIAYFECDVLALASHHAKRTRLTVLSSVARTVVPQLYMLSHKRCEFRERVIEKKRVLIFATTSV